MNHQRILYIVALAAFLGPFTQTIYAPLLPELQEQLHTTQFLVNLSISIFTFILALMQMVYGPLSDTKGRRKVMLFGIFIYILGSIGCSFSPTINWLLFFRAIQAIGIASGSVVATTVIGDLFEGKKRGRAMGTFQMMIALGPVMGPVIGGFLGGFSDFHIVFDVLAGTGVFMLLINTLYLRETKPDFQSKERFKLRDFLPVLQDRTGSAIIVLGFIQYYSYYNFLVFLPNVLTRYYGLSTEQKGLLFLPLSVMIVAGSYLGGRLQERVEARKTLLSTSFLNVVSIVLFIFAVRISLIALVVTICLFGLFLGLSLPVQTTLLTQAFVKNRATAVGVYNFFRYMGMAAGPILGSLLYNIGNIAALYGVAAGLFLAAVLFAQTRLKGENKKNVAA